MVKKYASSNLHNYSGFTNHLQHNISSRHLLFTMKAPWLFMVFFFLGLLVAQERSSNAMQSLFIAKQSTDTIHAPTFLSRYGYSERGSHGFVFFSPTDHDKPIYYRDYITTEIKYHFLHPTNTITNYKTNPS